MEALYRQEVGVSQGFPMVNVAVTLKRSHGMKIKPFGRSSTCSWFVNTVQHIYFSTVKHGSNILLNSCIKEND